MRILYSKHIGTQNTCQYECHVKKAIDICFCIPWDFLSNTDVQECDVFGRTCFFDAMKIFAKSANDSCNHCIKECDFIRYNRKIQNDKTQKTSDGKLMDYITNIKNRECFGSKTFCEVILDDDFTLSDKALHNTQHDNKPGDILNKFRNLIIVHLRFLKPQVDLIDSKYTIICKFANFGGIFGIFSQLTGCSL